MNKIQALLAGFAATVGAGGIAAYNGAFSPDATPVAVVSQPAPSNTETATPVPETKSAAVPEAAAPETAKPVETATAQTPATSPTPAPQPAGPVAPIFDVLRVEPNGSVLVAGKADPQATVEILNGSDVIGKAKAEMNGDFAIVLDTPLKPGDYQLVLRATRPDGQAASSVETATVSVPDQPNGPVLALVEQPGQPSRIITAPQAVEAKVGMSAEVPAVAAPAETPVAQASQAPAAEVAPTAPAEPAVPAPAPAADAASVGIEAVEVEGDRIYVAGKAGGAANVRIYANEELLGDAKPGEGDRFLLEIQKELAPGDYIIRAEGLAADGVTMLSRSSVPFQSTAPEPAQTTAAAPQPAQDPAASQPVAEPQKKNVIIRRGDTLWQISRRIYGRGVRYSTIYLANEGVTQNPNRIFPGQVFTIPEKTPEGEAANAEEISKRAEQPN